MAAGSRTCWRRGLRPSPRAARPGRDRLCDNGFSVISADGRRRDGRDPGTRRDGDRDHRRGAYPRRRGRRVPRPAPAGNHRPHLHPHPGARWPANSAGTGPWPASPTRTWTARPACCGAAWHRAPGTGTWPPSARSWPGAAATAGPPGTCSCAPTAAPRPRTTPGRSRCPSWNGCGPGPTSRCGNGRCGGCCTTPPPAPRKPSAWTSATSTWPTGRHGPAPRAAISGRCTSRPPPPGCWPGSPRAARPARCSSPPAGPPRTG